MRSIALGAMKLGKNAARHDSRTLELAAYLTAKLPLAPESVDFFRKVKRWPMMANNKTQDCTCAAAGHMIQEWTANASTNEVVLSDREIISAYAAISGYNPRTGEHDTGATALDVLNFWRRSGIGKHKIRAYAALEPKNLEHIRITVYLFGSSYFGFQLPASAKGQHVWAVPPSGGAGPGAPGSWGGHAVPVVGYDARTVTVVSWGHLIRATWGFVQMYCDEAYAVLSDDWLRQNKTPEGFSLTALDGDLKAVTA